MALIASVEKDGFSYAGDSLYCEASNHNRHRRATLPELEAHFSGKDTENRPAHWYEAQLLHYGLPPSKVKGTAHKRLFDAVTKGGLTVPAHIQKTEADLKKEWNKKEREAKKVMKESASASSSGKAAKRKADQARNVSVNVSVHINSAGSIKVQAAQPAAKKAKTSSTAPKAAKKPTAIKSNATPPAPKTKKTTPANPTATKAAANSKKATTTHATKDFKAVGKATSAPKSTKTPTKPKASPKQQTAQRPLPSSSSQTETPMFAFRGADANHNDAPPPYSEFDLGHSFSSPVRQLSSPQQRSPQRRIGLLNGRYEVSCPYIDGNFPEREHDLGLIATLDGATLWLTFDFGIVTGMMRADRPYEPDAEVGMMVYWRAHVSDRLVKIDSISLAGPVNRLWFLGEGHIRGSLRWRSAAKPIELQFDAYRLPGQSMTSEISPARARAEWAELE